MTARALRDRAGGLTDAPLVVGSDRSAVGNIGDHHLRAFTRQRIGIMNADTLGTACDNRGTSG